MGEGPGRHGHSLLTKERIKTPQEEPASPAGSCLDMTPLPVAQPGNHEGWEPEDKLTLQEWKNRHTVSGSSATLLRCLTSCLLVT